MWGPVNAAKPGNSHVNESGRSPGVARRPRPPAHRYCCLCGPLVPYSLDMTEPLLGRSIDRLEDERFVQGQGRYVDDLAVPGALHGIVVRSTHATRASPQSMSMRRVRCPASSPFSPEQELAADDIGPLPCAVTHIPMASRSSSRPVMRWLAKPFAMSGSPLRSSSRKMRKARATRPRPSSSTTSRWRRSFRWQSHSAEKSVDLA